MAKAPKKIMTSKMSQTTTAEIKVGASVRIQSKEIQRHFPYYFWV